MSKANISGEALDMFCENVSRMRENNMGVGTSPRMEGTETRTDNRVDFGESGEDSFRIPHDLAKYI